MNIFKSSLELSPSLLLVTRDWRFESLEFAEDIFLGKSLPSKRLIRSLDFINSIKNYLDKFRSVLFKH